MEFQFFLKSRFIKGIPTKSSKEKINTYVLLLNVYDPHNDLHLSDHDNRILHRSVLFFHNIRCDPYNKPGQIHNKKLLCLVLVLLEKVNNRN